MDCEIPRAGRGPLRAPRPGDALEPGGATARLGHAPEFFRGAHHFHQLAARARILAGHRQRLEVWCCGCHTGEDAYAAAMTLREAGCGGGVLATDPDTDALAVARRGIYGLAAVERLGAERMRRHFFVRGSDAACRVALVRGELRATVRFVCHDLGSPDWQAGDRFDFILCRDQLADRDRATQHRLLARLAASLAPGGVLFLGDSDPLDLHHPALLPCGRTAFERSASAA